MPQLVHNIKVEFKYGVNTFRTRQIYALPAEPDTNSPEDIGLIQGEVWSRQKNGWTELGELTIDRINNTPEFLGSMVKALKEHWQAEKDEDFRRPRE